MTQHELKTWPKYCAEILSGEKTFEIRKNDRDFKKGDILFLREFIPCIACNGTGKFWGSGNMTNCDCQYPHGIYTGLTVYVKVIYIISENIFGLEKGYVIMSIKKV